MTLTFNDTDGAERNRKLITEMRERESAKPVPHKGVNSHERHDHFEANKAEIIKDYHEHGRAFVRKKWNISETAFDSLTRRRWADDIKRIRTELHQE